MHADRLHSCLQRLLPHVDAARIALTGGVAIGMHVARHSGDHTRAEAAHDVDFVAASVDAIRPSAASDFLVSHFHLPQAGYPKFLVQLVDPVTRLRVDVFPDALQAIERARPIDIAESRIWMLEPSDMLNHTMRLLAGASAEAPVAEKHYLDAVRLGAICGRAIPPMMASHLGSTPFAQDLDATCRRCQVSRSADFPLAPKRAIYDVLGYV